MARSKLTDKELDYLKKKITANVVVLDSSGLPHITPIWVVEHKGRLYFSTTTNRVKYNHITHNQNIGINVLDPKGYPWISIAGHGSIKSQDQFSEYRAVADKIIHKYQTDASKIEEYRELLTKSDRILIELTPAEIIASGLS